MQQGLWMKISIAFLFDITLFHIIDNQANNRGLITMCMLFIHLKFCSTSTFHFLNPCDEASNLFLFVSALPCWHFSIIFTVDYLGGGGGCGFMSQRGLSCLYPVYGIRATLSPTRWSPFCRRTCIRLYSIMHASTVCKVILKIVQVLVICMHLFKVFHKAYAECIISTIMWWHLDYTLVTFSANITNSHFQRLTCVGIEII